jgi:hypothetical protein
MRLLLGGARLGLAAGLPHEAKNILTSKPSISAGTDAIAFQHSAVAPTPNRGDANLQEVGNLPGGQHCLKLNFLVALAHNSLAVLPRISTAYLFEP